MPTIDPNDDHMTLVNIFDVAEEQQQELVDLLVEATEETMRQMPGFVSANIHVSRDGTRVVNYAQWESREAFEAMKNSDEARSHMMEAAELADDFQPIVCEAVDSTPAPG